MSGPDPKGAGTSAGKRAGAGTSAGNRVGNGTGAGKSADVGSGSGSGNGTGAGRARKDGRPDGSRSWWWQSGLAVLRRPDLWITTAFEMRTLARRKWWRRWPPVPLPSKAWLEFRMETAYGDKEARPSAEDTLAWLEWCQDQRRQLAHSS